MRPRALPPALLAGLLFAAGCGKTPPPEEASFEFMGRRVHLEVDAATAPRLPRIVSILDGELGGLRQVFDTSNPRSEIRQVNRLAGQMTVPVSRTLMQIFVLSQRAHEASKGAFDLTLEPYLQIWGFRGDGPIPDAVPDDMLKAAGSVIGMARVSKRGNALRFANEVVSLSVDPVLNGYLADMGILRLRSTWDEEAPPAHAAVRVGRAIRVMGQKAPDRAWVFPVDDPLGGDTPLGRITLGADKHRMAATACHAFDRYVESAAGRISWILDPATGRPVEKTLYAMAVASTAFEANALAYALMVRGIEGAPELLGAFPNCEALVVPAGGKTLWMTAGLDGVFEPTAGGGWTVSPLARAKPAPEAKPPSTETPPPAAPPSDTPPANSPPAPPEATPATPAPAQGQTS